MHGCRYDIEAETAVRAMEAGMGLDMKLDKAATSIISPSNISPLLQVRANRSSAAVSRRIVSSIGRGRRSTRCNAVHHAAAHRMLLATQSGMLQHSTAADGVPDALHGRARAPKTAFTFGTVGSLWNPDAPMLQCPVA